jgi:DNA-binding NarL/FixJ family response regulator
LRLTLIAEPQRHWWEAEKMAATDNPFATVIVGRSALSRDSVGQLLGDTAFRVVDQAANVDQLAVKDAHQYEALLLILIADHDALWAVGQVKLFKGLYEASRIAVITEALRITELAPLFQAGANACFQADVRPETFRRSLELVVIEDQATSPNVPLPERRGT